MYQNYQMPNYYNPYQNSMMRAPQTAEVQQQFPQYNPMPASVLNGKIVDSKEVVKATEVAMGGYGIFPKADLSEIYTKVWNNNGTTSIITYRPIKEQLATENIEIPSDILDRIEKLERKIEELTNVHNAERGVNANAF